MIKDINETDIVRLVKVLKIKNGKFEVHYSINKARYRRTFNTKNLADEFIHELEGFIKGTRIRNTNSGTEIELFRAIYEALELQLRNDAITESTYYGNFKSAASILTKEEKLTKVNNIDQDFVLKIKRRLDKTKNGQKSCGSMFKTFKVILSKVQNYCNYKNYNNMCVDFKSLKTPTTPRKQPKPYTIEDYTKLTSLFDRSSNLNTKRKVASILINMQLGLRYGELACLNKDDIDLDDNSVKITKTVTKTKGKGMKIGNTTKNKRSRIVPIIGKTRIYIDFLLSFNSKFLIDCEHASRDRNLPITNATYRVWIKQISRLAGVRELSTHVAGRKSMATIVAQDMLRNNHDPFTVADTIRNILGHQSTELTLNIYIKPLLVKNDEVFSIFK